MPATLQKRAANDGNDVPFEQAFSSIAHSYLQDAAPMLLDHEIGFQLMDRSEDNQRVSGVMGFKVGSQLLLAPVFFLGGKLKGNELLYVSNEDLFVPLTEKWVMRLLHQKPLIIGKGIQRNTVSKGVRWPNLDQLRRPPPKYAGAQDNTENWLDAYLPLYAAMRARPATTWNSLLTSPRYKQASLPEMLKRASADVLKTLLVTVQAYPWLETQLEAFHGPDFLKNAVANARPAAAMPPKPAPQPGLFDHVHPIKSGALQIFTYSTLKTSILPVDLTEEEQEELTREGVVIRDKRDEKDPEAPVSRAYRVTRNWNLTNPTESGIYDVLLAGGRFEKCVVVCKPHNGTNISDAVVVTPLGSDKNWFAAASNKVWINEQYPDNEWKEWYDALPETGTLKASRTRYMIVNKNGVGTQPFRVRQVITDDSGRKSLRVQFEYVSHDLLESNFATDTDNYTPHLTKRDCRWSTDSTWLVIKPEKFGSFSHTGDGLAVPEHFKVVQLSAEEPLKEWELDEDRYGDVDDKFQPGSGADVNHLMMSKLASLKLWTDRKEFDLNGSRLTKSAALVSLVRDYGFSVPTSREMLKQAEHAAYQGCGQGSVRYFIKLASPWDNEDDEGPGGPAIPEQQSMDSSPFSSSRANSVAPDKQLLPATAAAHGDNSDRYQVEPLDADTMRDIDQASQTGQKELFDASVIKGIIKGTNVNHEIDECIDGLFPGMDRLGRLLCLLYSHGAEFADRFGKSDLQELEDGIQSAFDKTGELILFLETRQVEGDPQSARLQFNLDQ